MFGCGAAGSGKTYCAVATAMHLLKEKEVSKIVITRPAVEAGESLGFLPGTMEEKILPYLMPIYDAIDDLVGKPTREKMIEQGVIEILPLAYMRGRTLSNCIIILDEAQNTTKSQMKMLLTRIGKGSKAIVNGDHTQKDLPANVESGLMDAVNRLQGMRGISATFFDADDVVRHPVVKSVIKAYEHE